MTPLGLVNFVVLQWVGVRLARVIGPDREFLCWRWLRWICPLTGWWSDYRWIRKVRT